MIQVAQLKKQYKEAVVLDVPELLISKGECFGLVGNNGAGKLAKLYKDFGDIRNEDFAEWWGGSSQKGGYLFGETPNDINLRQLNDKSEWSEDWNENIAVFAVNLSIGRRKLQQYFAAQLETIHKADSLKAIHGFNLKSGDTVFIRNYMFFILFCNKLNL